MSTSELICQAIDLLEAELTEANTDAAIAFLLSKVPEPAIAKMVENKVLDELFPEHFIGALRSMFKCEGAIISSTPTV